jgi:hypothetical protein
MGGEGMPAGHPAMGGEGMPAGHPAMGGEGMPAGHPAMGAPEGHGGMAGEMPNAHAPADPKARVSGTITVAPSVKDAIKPGDVIFVVVRQGDEKGTMLGAKRYVADRFPLSFELDNRDAMFAGTKFGGPVTITARVDKDGDATTKLPGDVVGVAHAEVGNRDIKLLIDTIAK